MTSADLASSKGPDRARRRVFTNDYKLAMVAEYDAASERGARGALLRREGLYDSHIGKWRRARDEGRLSPNGTPAPAKTAAAAQRENARLRAQVEALTAELDSTKAVLDIVGKASGLLQAISDRQEPSKRSSRS
jgi:transposase-like protein